VGEAIIGTAGSAGSVDPVADLARARAVLLTTFRRDGRSVATPVWLAAHEGRLYVTTPAASGKAKRLRHNARVLVAPCTQTGKPTGPTVAARARLLDPAETRVALAAIRRRYGVFDALFSLVNRLQGEAAEVGIELLPGDRA
jgi:hypothetical protein